MTKYLKVIRKLIQLEYLGGKLVYILDSLITLRYLFLAILDKVFLNIFRYFENSLYISSKNNQNI